MRSSITTTPDYSRQDSMTYYPVTTNPSERMDMIIGGFGIVDQAIQGLLHLRELPRMPYPPRSVALEAFQIYHQFGKNPKLSGQLRLIAAAGGCVSRLARDWKSTVANDGMSAPKLSNAERTYMLASLAAASVLIPYLMLRKRNSR